MIKTSHHGAVSAELGLRGEFLDVEPSKLGRAICLGGSNSESARPLLLGCSRNSDEEGNQVTTRNRKGSEVPFNVQRGARREVHGGAASLRSSGSLAFTRLSVAPQ
jgi:hypothetical protein